MKIGRLTIVKISDESLRATPEEQIEALRKGGFPKMAARRQAKLDKEAGR